MTAYIYLKSGHIIKLRKVSKLEWSKTGSEFTKLSWSADAGDRLEAIDLDQIAAITSRGKLKNKVMV